VNIVLIIGYIVIAIGAFLWCGNVFQFFHTFPLAGYGTMLIGGIITKKAKG
jgi:hypothetical protein